MSAESYVSANPLNLSCSTFLAPGVNPAQGVFIEMFTTSILVLAVLMLAAEKHYATPFAPVSALAARSFVSFVIVHAWMLGWHRSDALHGPYVRRPILSDPLTYISIRRLCS